MRTPGFSPSLLRTNLADLAKLRQAMAGARPAAQGEPGRLEEVSGFGPNPGGLRMWRYVPRALPPGAPLVVAVHGCTQNASGFDAGTGWSQLAERHRFAVLLPEQQGANNQNTCFNWFEPGDTTRGLGEVASVRSMVARMQADHRLDPARIFVTGLSAGGAMASALLATYPDVFVAGAVIAGLPYRCASNMAEALAVMHRPHAHTPAQWGDRVRNASPAPQRKPVVALWHGEADQVVVSANAFEHAKQWCDVHGLTEAQQWEQDGARRWAWRDAAGAARVELWMVPNLGHGVPINPEAPGDQGVGRPMPYMLPSPVSSTWHIARSWGLL